MTTQPQDNPRVQAIALVVVLVLAGLVALALETGAIR